MHGVLKDAYDMPLSAVTARRASSSDVSDRAKTPSQANNFLNTMRALFSGRSITSESRKDPTEA